MREPGQAKCWIELKPASIHTRCTTGVIESTCGLLVSTCFVCVPLVCVLLNADYCLLQDKTQTFRNCDVFGSWLDKEIVCLKL